MKEEKVGEIGEIGNSRLLPFLLGGVVGAGIALLLAPKPGKEMRKQIKEFATNTKETVSSALDRTKEIYGETKSMVSSAIDAGKQAFVKEKEAHVTTH